jgi:hypothetical protein
MPHLLATLAIAAPVALGLASAPAGPPSQEVFAFDDPAITAASALVLTDDGLFVTTNDSGHPGDVFVVDRSGRTVGVTHWSDDPVDVEALAPGGPGHVWVGDIGDNTAVRSSVEIARVPVGRGDRTVDPTTYTLTYPDGATDAETLLRDPTNGRLYIASKNVFGGVLYAVPQHLDPSGPNLLKAVGRVLPVATDGSFFPDGRPQVVRDYSSAVVYAWPSLEPVGRMRLPNQRQGEGIAVTGDGQVYLSSEGPHAPVLETSLPPKLQAVMSGESSGPGSPSASPPARGPLDSTADEPDASSHDAWPWIAGGVFALLALVVLLRALRPPR